MINSGVFYLIFCCLLISVHIIQGSTISYTATGHWTNETVEEECNHYRCTENKFAWNSSDPTYKRYTKEEACDALVERGVRKVYFLGDSYMRHIYAAMMIFFTGDYRAGSLADPEGQTNCHYQRQFFEKRCNSHLLQQNGTICGGRVYLDPVLHGFDNLHQCERSKGTVMLWSFGNHKLSKGRYGVNNATAYQMHFNNICRAVTTTTPPITGQFDDHCSIWWISTHARRIGWFGDEFPEVVRDFNTGMRGFFDAKGCGHVNYIDVFNMTTTLLSERPSDAEHLTFDNVHWGMEVNLLKVQIIVNALISQNNK